LQEGFGNKYVQQVKKGSLCQDSACPSTWVPNKQQVKQTKKDNLAGPG
jgi:hypothetical protein